MGQIRSWKTPCGTCVNTARVSTVPIVVRRRRRRRRRHRAIMGRIYYRSDIRLSDKRGYGCMGPEKGGCTSNPRYAQVIRYVQENLWPEVTDDLTKSSSLDKQLLSSSKMRFLQKRKAFKKKKEMLVKKRKAVTNLRLHLKTGSALL